jgi:hypothetical protein
VHVLAVSVALWIADSPNHLLLLAAMAPVGITLAFDDRLRDWIYAIVAWTVAWTSAVE